jgi:hypothetical protein
MSTAIQSFQDTQMFFYLRALIKAVMPQVPTGKVCISFAFEVKTSGWGYNIEKTPKKYLSAFLKTHIES